MTDKDPKTMKLDTASLKKPDEKLDPETPIGDEVAKELGYLDSISEEDVTHFEEDDNPTQFAGDPVKED